MKRFLPFLILLGGAVGMYFLWKKLFNGGSGLDTDAGSIAEKDAKNLFEANLANEALTCANKGGTYVRNYAAMTGLGANAPQGSCYLPPKDSDYIPVNFGGCPDMQSCTGYDPRSGATVPAWKPPYAPAPANAAPTGTSSLPLTILGGGKTTYASGSAVGPLGR